HSRAARGARPRAPVPARTDERSVAGTQPHDALPGVDHVGEVVQVAEPEDTVERRRDRVVDYCLHVAGAVAAQVEVPDGHQRNAHLAVRGDDRDVLPARPEPEAARDALADHAVGGPGVEEELTLDAAIQGGADGPGLAVALERDLATPHAAPVRAPARCDQRSGEAEEGEEAPHRMAGGSGAAARRSSRQMRTLRTRSRPLNGLVM